MRSAGVSSFTLFTVAVFSTRVLRVFIARPPTVGVALREESHPVKKSGSHVEQ
jgi:hypothetical protein